MVIEMSLFNLKEAKKHPERLITKGGYKVERILCWDSKSVNGPIIAEIEGFSEPIFYNENGWHSGGQSDLGLFLADDKYVTAVREGNFYLKDEFGEVTEERLNIYKRGFQDGYDYFKNSLPF